MKIRDASAIKGDMLNRNMLKPQISGTFLKKKHLWMLELKISFRFNWFKVCLQCSLRPPLLMICHSLVVKLPYYLIDMGILILTSVENKIALAVRQHLCL